MNQVDDKIAELREQIKWAKPRQRVLIRNAIIDLELRKLSIQRVSATTGVKEI